MTWYADYLKSPHWQATRDWALDRAGKRCQLCNSPKRPEVHHRSYERLGNERPTDVVVLCDNCHGRFHEVLPEAPPSGPTPGSANKAGKWNVLRNRYRSTQ